MVFIEVPDHWPARMYDNFIRKVKELPNGCYEWQGARSKDGRGYAIFNIYGKTTVVHPYLWQYHYGDYEGHLDHVCKNMGCINLDHLENTTVRENVVVRSEINIVALNARKTHCDHGHEFTPENTYNWKNKRICRECGRKRAREWKERTGYRLIDRPRMGNL